MNRRNLRGVSAGSAALGCVLASLCLPDVRAAGLTIFVHGQNGDVNGWSSAMAQAMANRSSSPGQSSIMTMDVIDVGSGFTSIAEAQTPTLDSGPAPWTASHNGEVMLKIDWADVDTGFSSPEIAQTVSERLLSEGASGVDWTAAPIHLIGHSRGGSVVPELAREFGKLGIWVDQVTTLDPHPVDGVNEVFPWIDFDDTTPVHWENIRFFDNYWRTDGPNSFDFTGEPVAEAHNLQLSESVLATGAHSFDHSDVPLWYIGTIDLSPDATDGEYTVGANWYDGAMGPRDEVGFAYSALGGIEPPADGVAERFGGGANTTAINLSGGSARPNVGGLQVMEAPSVHIVGDMLSLSVDYEDRDSEAAIAFFLDDDRNPFNGRASAALLESVLPATDGTIVNELFAFDTSADVSDLAGGLYLLAMIDDGEHARFSYGGDLLSFYFRGDMDGNGVFDAFDVDEFELALADPQAYQNANPDLDADLLGDFDGSSGLDAFDVNGFEVALSGASVPEPVGWLGLALSGMMLRRRRGVNHVEQASPIRSS